jgi:hypothetical protein
MLTARAWQYRSRPTWAVVLVVVRALTMLLALQFCGAIHDFTDAVRSVASADDAQHEKCPANGPCDDCPPGCPNCHCAAVGSVVPETRVEVEPDLLVTALSLCLYDTRVVAGPDRPTLFRPPRA